MEHGPIFIGGLDCSGKTPMRLALSAHPNFALTRRTRMWTRFYNRYGDLSQRNNFERCLAAMLRHKPMRMLKPNPDRIRREFWQGEPTYTRLFALFHEHYAEQLGRPRWGEQSGLIERYADLIFAAYPAAKMIHMIRDPRARHVASLAPAGNSLRIGKVGEATARWLYSVSLAERNQGRYPDSYKIVRCEMLMSRREETLREVCAFLGEDYTPTMLTLEGAIRFGEADTEESGDDSVTSRSGGGQGMTKGETAFMQAYAGRDMAAYGYALEPVRFSLGDGILFNLIDHPINLTRMAAWQTFKARPPVRVDRNVKVVL